MDRPEHLFIQSGGGLRWYFLGRKVAVEVCPFVHKVAHELYQSRLLTNLCSASEREDIERLMGWYAEDVTRLVEREVKEVEREIRISYPAAAYIELGKGNCRSTMRVIVVIEPDSRDSMNTALPKDIIV